MLPWPDSASPTVRMARLMWSPRSLPHAALHVPLLSGIKGGFVGWFVLSGLLLAPLGVTGRSFDSWLDCAVTAIATAMASGVAGSLIVMTLVLLLVPISEDETSMRGRAQLNIWMMLPFGATGPMSAWAFLAVTTDSSIDARGGALPWASSAIARGLAAPIWPAVLAVAMFVASQWATWLVRRRLDSGTCISCGYLLTGLLEPRCPECGRAILPGQPIHPATCIAPGAPGPILSFRGAVRKFTWRARQ